MATCTATLNPSLKDFWIEDGVLIQSRHRVLYGGRASSKSWEFCGRLAQIAQQYKTRILCCRRYQNKIKDSVYTLIKSQIDNFDFGGYQVLSSSIEHENGSEFIFLGIDRSVEEIKSLEGIDVLYIEEGHNLTQDQWEILEPTIRKEGSEIWISFNPRLMTDFVYRRFILNPPKNTRSRLINYTENSFLSKTLLESIEEMKADDFENYQHIYLGIPKSDDENSVIKRSWIEAVIDAHLHLDIELNGARCVGYDVADSGADKNAAAIFDGAICVGMDEWKGPEDELVESAIRAWSHVIGGSLIYDSIGVGAHVGSTLRGKDITAGFYKFNAAGAVVNPNYEYAPTIKNKAKFENLKAQAWQDVADRFRNTYNAINKGQKYEANELISISSELPFINRLKDELCLPLRSYSKRGLDMVEPKDSIKKRGFESPNLADSFIMGACPNLVKSSIQSMTTRFAI